MLSVLLQTYGISPSAQERFPGNIIPIPEKYIVIQSGAELQSQRYDFYPEVISLVFNILQNKGIQVLQVGDKEDSPIPYVTDYRGALSVRQVSYVIQNSLGCISSNLLTSSLCRVYEKSLVFLSSNFPRNELKKENKNLILIEGKKDGAYTYVTDEEFKNINTIKPEEVAQSILYALGINETIKFSSIFIGKKFSNSILDFIPDYVLPQDFYGKPVNVRLDVFHNPIDLDRISITNPIFISTKKPINLTQLNIKNIQAITLFCDKDVDVEFVKKCIAANIKLFVVVTNLDYLNDIRFKLLGIKEVYKKIFNKPLDFSDKYAINYHSSRIYIGRNKLYPSLMHYKQNIDSQVSNAQFDQSWSDNEDFLEGLDSFYFFTHEPNQNI
jgi:hypothetical protein